jgi:N-acetylglucosaminyl-diphospho-decaprenol L-rhamnosyltransferase
MTAGRPKVAVVVVTWNSAEPLAGLLASLDAGLEGVAHQLVVVDNDSADDTVAVARRLVPDCRIVQTGRNAGYAAGINAGLAVAEPYDAVLVLNPDVRLSPGCVAALHRELGDGVGIAVPLIRHDDGTIARSLRREPTIGRALGDALLGARAGRVAWLGETVLDDAEYHRPTVCDWATGAVMLISAECAAACGPWDESFFLYSEETEFALRARDRGLRTRFVPGAEVVHSGGESRVSPRLWSLLTVNRVRLYRKRHSAPATAVFWSAVLLREGSRALLGQRRSRRAVAALLGLSRPGRA